MQCFLYNVYMMMTYAPRQVEVISNVSGEGSISPIPIIPKHLFYLPHGADLPHCPNGGDYHAVTSAQATDLPLVGALDVGIGRRMRREGGKESTVPQQHNTNTHNDHNISISNTNGDKDNQYRHDMSSTPITTALTDNANSMTHTRRRQDDSRHAGGAAYYYSSSPSVLDAEVEDEYESDPSLPCLSQETDLFVRSQMRVWRGQQAAVSNMAFEGDDDDDDDT